jgi:aminoglycoside 6'-N-acetyltransferase I
MQTTEMAEIIAQPEAKQVFVFQREPSGLGGFIEVFIRERTNGAVSPRVGYIEGWYVDADLRQRGIGEQLLVVAEGWLRRQGLTEVASDTDINNTTSVAIHQHLGFEETYRLVHFLKEIDPEG